MVKKIKSTCEHMELQAKTQTKETSVNGDKMRGNPRT